MNTELPKHAFIIKISELLIPSNDTSIERCNANIETSESANEIFLRTTSVSDAFLRAFIRLIIANTIFVNVYAAMAIITIICRSCPLSRNTESITVPASGIDSSINIHPVNLAMKRSPDLERSTTKRTMLKTR